MGTQVITRDTGRRLGVVGEVVVDVDRREVVALGLRDNPLTRFLPGLPRWMPLESIRQVGDVILVDSSDSLSESFNPERYSKVINCQVITESGQTLGRVLGFSFDIETGELVTLVIGALGVPLLAEGVLSTWELPVSEVVSSGSDRIIVYEGSEDKLKQLGTGLLEKMGIGGGSWEREERERWRAAPVPAENQLPAGQPSAQEQRRIQPAVSRSFQPEEAMEYVELEERRQREPLRQRRYLDEDSPRDTDEESRREPYGAAYGERDYAPRRPSERERLRDRGEDRDRGWERDAERPREPSAGSGRREAANGSSTDRDSAWAVDRELGAPPADREVSRIRSAEAGGEEWRRPPAAGSPQLRDDRARGMEPVDVEPEILDDPW
ncbi:MAG: PRC-barrel domain-containing protein [Cyanobacteriota bacterium]|nr:PRC-barrel domain-containing protein [Cyanobacteriota bacterium]